MSYPGMVTTLGSSLRVVNYKDNQIYTYHERILEWCSRLQHRDWCSVEYNVVSIFPKSLHNAVYSCLTMSQITILLSSEAFDILTVYLVKELPSIWVLVPKDVCDFGLSEESSTTRWMGFPLGSLLDTGVMSGNQFRVRQYGIIMIPRALSQMSLEIDTPMRLNGGKP